MSFQEAFSSRGKSSFIVSNWSFGKAIKDAIPSRAVACNQIMPRDVDWWMLQPWLKARCAPTLEYI